MVIRFTENQDTKVADIDKKTKEFFFETLEDEFSDLYPFDQKLLSLKYNEKTRDYIR